jgi:hypothetical protein
MRNHRFSFLKFIGAVAILASFAIAPVGASAQDQLSDPSAAQYDPGIPQQGISGVLGDQTSGASSVSPAAAAASSGGDGDGALGTLPFTGMDLLIVAGVALVLFGTGVALRRLSLPQAPRG